MEKVRKRINAENTENVERRRIINAERTEDAENAEGLHLKL